MPRTDVIIAIVAVVSFLMAVAGVAGSWRASKNTGALSQYRETAKAWEGRSRVQDQQIADLNSHVAGLETEMHHKDAQLAEQKGRIQVLQDTLTGKASWDILERRISEALELAGLMRTEVRQMHENQDQMIQLLRGK